MKNILLLAGSTRINSLNKKLIKYTESLLQDKASPTFIDLKDYPVPIYNGDLEESEGVPENAKKFAKLIENSDAIIIASPEYNGLPSPILKNIIDWSTRVSKTLHKDKLFALMSASPGALGGARNLSHLTTLLNNIGAKVIGSFVSVPHALEAFDPQDNLKDPILNEAILNQINKIIAN